MILHTLGYWLNPSSLPLPPLLFYPPTGYALFCRQARHAPRPSTLDITSQISVTDHQFWPVACGT